MSTDRQQLFYRCCEAFKYTRPLKLQSDCQSLLLLLIQVIPVRYWGIFNRASDLDIIFFFFHEPNQTSSMQNICNVLTVKVACILESLGLLLIYCMIKFWVLIFFFSFKVYFLYVLNLEIKCVKWEQKDLEQHAEGCSQNKERIWAALPASLTELLSRA